MFQKLEPNTQLQSKKDLLALVTEAVAKQSLEAVAATLWACKKQGIAAAAVQHAVELGASRAKLGF